MNFALLFFEPSTRTNFSFQTAINKLNGTFINYNQDYSSHQKGESLYDTIKTMESYSDALIVRHPERGMVEKIDFFTSFGHGSGGNERKSRNINTEGPSLLITDLAIWKPDPISKEFTVHSLHTGVSKEMVQDSCGWKVKYSDNIEVTEPPTELELKTLRDLKERTKIANSRKDTNL